MAKAPRPRPRRGGDGQTSVRAIIASSAFLVLFSVTLMVGGHAAIDPLLRSAMAARETRELGDVVVTMADGKFCRHMSFDNATAEIVEGKVGPCPDSVSRGAVPHLSEFRLGLRRHGRFAALTLRPTRARSYFRHLSASRCRQRDQGGTPISLRTIDGARHRGYHRGAARFATSGEKLMRIARSIGWLLLLSGVLFYRIGGANAEVSNAVKQACTPDAMRLCADFIPDVAKVTACMHRSIRS